MDRKKREYLHFDSRQGAHLCIISEFTIFRTKQVHMSKKHEVTMAILFTFI
jgi:hypothetical protein